MSEKEELAGLGDRLLGMLRIVNAKSARHLSLADAELLVEELLAEAATQKWVAEQTRQIGVRSMEFRNGATMDLEPAREMLAMWIGACRGLIGDGPNYSETPMDLLAKVGDKVEMGVKIAESPAERYVITVQRDQPGTLTPHELRRAAEVARDLAVKTVWKWIIAVNNGAGFDAGDLAFSLERLGLSCPEGLEEEMEEEG